MNLMDFAKAQWDRVGAWASIALGALVLLLGYLGISDTPHVASQLPYLISGGLFGIFLLGVGGMLWISADLRDEWRELYEIRDLMSRSLAEPTVDPSSGAWQPVGAASLEREPAVASESSEPSLATVSSTASRPRRRRAAAGDAQ